ncbi:hemin receptor [Photobacterium jeanii]|uniref:Hemin receptor n=1 Tax=Photobacterium jeanii TaxID=858640 RepID=A0A178KKP4_9GAMM|nr:ABC transporter substrate-binding protein [Photobacterium jeanii]OAN17696.1 hemin receptor [Photobacterium jeanii]PST92646.1 hemin ABC transporter substrate-binding protein [Photobacterium jeanii]
MKRLVLATTLLLATTNSWANERIISAGSAITELINAMGAQNQVVAVDATSRSMVSNDIPKLGYHRALSAESLIALTPTRILGSEEMGPKTTLDMVKQAGIEIDIVNSGETVTDLLKRIDTISRITGKESEAVNLKQKVNQQVANIKANNQSVKQPIRVLFLSIHEGRPATVGGNNTTADTVIRLAGAVNPAAAQIESYKPISTEAMVEMQPDVIMLSSRTYNSIGQADGLLEKMPLLAATPAGAKKAVVVIDGTALIGGLGLKSLSEAERLNQVFYP